MLQKSISILLVFTVNIFLLTQAALPHHHHNGIPHFTFSQAEERHDHSVDPCCCTHNEKEDDSCSFDKEVDLLFFQDEHLPGTVCCSEHIDFSGHLLTAVLFSFSNNIFALRQDIPLRTPHFLISYHTDPVISSTGLRAPPMART